MGFFSNLKDNIKRANMVWEGKKRNGIGMRAMTAKKEDAKKKAIQLLKDESLTLEKAGTLIEHLNEYAENDTAVTGRFSLMWTRFKKAHPGDNDLAKATVNLFTDYPRYQQLLATWGHFGRQLAQNLHVGQTYAPRQRRMEINIDQSPPNADAKKLIAAIEKFGLPPDDQWVQTWHDSYDFDKLYSGLSPGDQQGRSILGPVAGIRFLPSRYISRFEWLFCPPYERFVLAVKNFLLTAVKGTPNPSAIVAHYFETTTANLNFASLRKTSALLHPDGRDLDDAVRNILLEDVRMLSLNYLKNSNMWTERAFHLFRQSGNRDTTVGAEVTKLIADGVYADGKIWVKGHAPREGRRDRTRPE